MSLQISKSNVVDDMVESNDILYATGEKPDHVVVIKYVPYVGKCECNKLNFLSYFSSVCGEGTLKAPKLRWVNFRKFCYR